MTTWNSSSTTGTVTVTWSMPPPDDGLAGVLARLDPPPPSLPPTRAAMKAPDGAWEVPV